MFEIRDTQPFTEFLLSAEYLLVFLAAFASVRGGSVDSRLCDSMPYSVWM